MFNIDTSKKSATSDSLFGSDKQVLHAVRVEIPYLDVPFSKVAPEISDLMLATTMSILISRYTRNPSGPVFSNSVVGDLFGDMSVGSMDVKEFLNEAEDYENSSIDAFLSNAMEYESEYNSLIPTDENLVLKEDEYRTIIQEVLAHYDKYFINYPNEHNEEQIEYLIGSFETKGRIDIKYYSYDPDSGRLHMFIPL